MSAIVPAPSAPAPEVAERRALDSVECRLRLWATIDPCPSRTNAERLEHLDGLLNVARTLGAPRSVLIALAGQAVQWAAALEVDR